MELFRVSLPSTITLVSKVDRDTCPVIADPTKVHEALMNLATNAVHAMDEKGELKVILREDTIGIEKNGIMGPIAPGIYSIIEVEDTGKGMDNALIERIFKPFYTTKGEGKGTGLGLSVVYGAMQSHSGNIEIESNRDKGTVFRLFFPKISKEVVSEIASRPQVPKGNEIILFVDDENSLVEMRKSMLSSLLYKVTAVTESRVELELLTNRIQDFDLLITDQTMPHISGIELARTILKLNPEFPIIICTGFSSKVDEKKAKEIGCRDFAVKPLTKRILAEKIRRALGA